MIILGILGSPRVKGNCAKLMQSALDGAKSRGADIKRFDLIKLDIKHCMGCCKCFTRDPELQIGKCPIKDDMSWMLEEYIQADGYVLASPVYDMAITSLLKKFFERKIPLNYRPSEAYSTMVAPRVTAGFKKKALMIVTANGSDEYREPMGDPCFEAMEVDFMLEQVETLEQHYIGGMETISEESFSQKLDMLYQSGRRLVEEIETAYGSEGSKEVIG